MLSLITAMGYPNKPESPLPLNLQEELFSFGKSLLAETRALVGALWEKGPVSAELKGDRSPVTLVDIQVEELLRRRIEARYSSHGIIGEEFGVSNPGSDFQWIIDPIDGTDNLVRRIPSFGSLLCLRYKGAAALGFIDHPALGLCLEGGPGIGVFHNGKPLAPLADEALSLLPEEEAVGLSTPKVAQRSSSMDRFDCVIRNFPNTRIYYDCYAHSLAILGSLTATVELSMNVWDIAPAEALIRGTGKAFEYLSGSAEDEAKGYHHAVFGHPVLVERLCALLKR